MEIRAFHLSVVRTSVPFALGSRFVFISRSRPISTRLSLLFYSFWIFIFPALLHQQKLFPFICPLCHLLFVYATPHRRHKILSIPCTGITVNWSTSSESEHFFFSYKVIYGRHRRLMRWKNAIAFQQSPLYRLSPYFFSHSMKRKRILVFFRSHFNFKLKLIFNFDR